LEALGVPVTRREQVSETFTVPVKKRPLIVTKPAASSRAYKPEPALDAEVYRHILRVCHDCGLEIERHPSIYAGKSEETLRDHFLMVLSPHFQSVTGETFNKKGRTDILIRHDAANVFVAECKFWKGQRAHTKTIDQLLGYLTWRDSKAAILCFVRNRELTPVLTSLVTATRSHGCFTRDEGEAADGWYSFQFHLPSAPDRRLQLAVLCFHFCDHSD